MVPKVAKRGTSFNGALAYYLHDKIQDGETVQPTTSERVAWTETRGFFRDNVDPKIAGRIMAATAMDKDRLKRDAGVRNTGQKSKGDVYCYSIAWNPEERPHIDKAEMLKAVDQSMKAIGAQDRQAIIICHNDTDHPHVHVVLNLVSPNDGRNLSVHADRNKLSAWALSYRKERGEEHKYTPKRAEKAEAIERKKRGEKVDFVAGEKSRRRSAAKDFKEAQVANDNKAIIEEKRQNELDAGLSVQAKSTHHRHKREWVHLSDRYRFKKADIYKQAGDAIGRAKEQVRARYEPAFRDLYRELWREKQHWEERERTITGKIKNVMDALAFRKASGFTDEDKGWTSAAFSFLASKKARADALEKAHRAAKRHLSSREREELGAIIHGIKDDRGALLSSARTTFSTERTTLIARQADEKQQIKLKWRQRNKERLRAFQAIKIEADLKRGAKASENPRDAMRREGTKAAHKIASENRKRSKGRVRKRTRRRDHD